MLLLSELLKFRKEGAHQEGSARIGDAQGEWCLAGTSYGRKRFRIPLRHSSCYLWHGARQLSMVSPEFVPEHLNVYAPSGGKGKDGEIPASGQRDRARSIGGCLSMSWPDLILADPDPNRFSTASSYRLPRRPNLFISIALVLVLVVGFLHSFHISFRDVDNTSRAICAMGPFRARRNTNLCHCHGDSSKDRCSDREKVCLGNKIRVEVGEPRYGVEEAQ